jgi:hypothetical protein
MIFFEFGWGSVPHHEMAFQARVQQYARLVEQQLQLACEKRHQKLLKKVKRHALKELGAKA